MSVQDLTKQDIRLYVEDNLERDPRFEKIQAREPRHAQRLIIDICVKAQGVFLWIHIVVNPLLRGLKNKDEMRHLQERFDELPDTLEKYFQQMMDNIEPVYRLHTARALLTMVCATGTLPLIAFHFLDEELEDPNYAVSLSGQPLGTQELKEIMDKKQWQLNARCRDLLQIVNIPDEADPFTPRVGFLHRTVLDFLRTKEVDQLLVSRAGDLFRPVSGLCKICLALCKIVPMEYLENNLPSPMILGTL